MTRLLQDQLALRGFGVTVGKPEDAGTNNVEARLNLFLFEIAFDPHLRNVPLGEAGPRPLWLVLRYLLTAYDAESSDSIAAHELLGRGVAALHSLAVLRPDTLDAGVRTALENNPEPLKLTFDDSAADLLSKVMQGSDEHYRLSVAFQIRPVMIVPGEVPRAALLVGVDYTTAPATTVGEEGITIAVLPSLGPRLERVEPAAFEAGAAIEVFGTDLSGGDLEVLLGERALTIGARQSDRLLVIVEGELEGNLPGPIASGAAISAGELPLIVRRRLSATRTRSSNLLAARLLPTLESASLVGGDLVMNGVLLGNDTDDVIVALYREADGLTVKLFDAVETVANQRTLTVTGAAAGIATGSYLVVLRVNDQQARSSPRVMVG